jgi:Fibronectin type III domain
MRSPALTRARTIATRWRPTRQIELHAERKIGSGYRCERTPRPLRSPDRRTGARPKGHEQILRALEKSRVASRREAPSHDGKIKPTNLGIKWRVMLGTTITAATRGGLSRWSLLVVAAMVVALGVWTAPASAAVFWSNYDTGFIERAAQDGSHAEPSFLHEFGTEVVVAGDDVYWAQAGGTTIGRAHVTASGVSSSDPRFITGITNVTDLAVSGGHIYWTYQPGYSSEGSYTGPYGVTVSIPTSPDTAFVLPDGIGRATLNGSKPASHVDQEFINSDEHDQTDDIGGSYAAQSGGAGAIAVSSSGIYWFYGDPPYNSLGDQIWHALLNGSQARPIITTSSDGSGPVDALTIDGSYIYWTSYRGNEANGYGGDGAIGRAQLSGTQATHVDQTFVPVNAFDVASEGHHLYWAGGDLGGDIGTAQLNGVHAASSVKNRFIAGADAESVAVGPLPIDTRLPTISGAARNQGTLTAHHGSFSGNPTNYSYLWKECNTNGAHCRTRPTSKKYPLSADTRLTYRVSPPDIGDTIRVVVTAYSSQGSASATSAATAMVPYLVPVAITGPVIVGSPIVGKTLTLIHGTYTNHPTTYHDEWILCGLGGQSCNHQAPHTSLNQPSLPLIIKDEFGAVELREIAINSHGDSLPTSSASTAEVIAGPPGAPNGVTGVAGPGQVAVSFVAPASNGSAITSYTVTASPGGASATGAGSPIVVTGLTDGTQYTFTATATNSVGTGPPSQPSTSVVPAGVPDAPTGVTAVARAGSASVSFTVPASNGAPITGYTVTAISSNGGASQTATGTASAITVIGLTSFKDYTFTITATNSVGTGPPSAASNSITAR